MIDLLYGPESEDTLNLSNYDKEQLAVLAQMAFLGDKVNVFLQIYREREQDCDYILDCIVQILTFDYVSSNRKTNSVKMFYELINQAAGTKNFQLSPEYLLALTYNYAVKGFKTDEEGGILLEFVSFEESSVIKVKVEDMQMRKWFIDHLFGLMKVKFGDNEKGADGNTIADSDSNTIAAADTCNTVAAADTNTVADADSNTMAEVNDDTVAGSNTIADATTATATNTNTATNTRTVTTATPPPTTVTSIVASLLADCLKYPFFDKNQSASIELLELLANNPTLLNQFKESNIKFTLNFDVETLEKYFNFPNFEETSQLIKLVHLYPETLVKLKSKDHIQKYEKLLNDNSVTSTVADMYLKFESERNGHGTGVNEIDYFRWRLVFAYWIENDRGQRMREIASPAIIGMLKLEYPAIEI